MTTMSHRLTAGATLDHYRLERELGSGAFGAVWLAVDEGTEGFQKQVALKVMSRKATEESVGSLLREARITGLLRHPNIVDCYGITQSPDACFIVMEYVEGETLASMWRDLEFIGVPFPRSVILDISIAVCEALHHAWSTADPEGTPLHIVHRDLKPANVMLSLRGEVKVGDFGIAKVVEDESTTITGKVKGTPSYLAPELWLGERQFTPAIDLWSLGVLIWEMGSLKRFYGRSNIGQIFDTIKRRTPLEEAEQLQAHFPEIVPLLSQLLQRDPELRPQEPLQVAEELRELRQQIGPSGDLLQFVRIVRAGRLEPTERLGSLVALPRVPTGATDWMPLIEVASEAEGPLSPTGEAAERQPQSTQSLWPTGALASDAPSTAKATSSPDEGKKEARTASGGDKTADITEVRTGETEARLIGSRAWGSARITRLIILVLALTVVLLLLDRLGVL